LKVLLNKSWRSQRGKSYTAGTLFVRSSQLTSADERFAWWDYTCPDGSYGSVRLPLPSFFSKKNLNS
jgi:hypothetical protein